MEFYVSFVHAEGYGSLYLTLTAAPSNRAEVEALTDIVQQHFPDRRGVMVMAWTPCK